MPHKYNADHWYRIPKTRYKVINWRDHPPTTAPGKPCDPAPFSEKSPTASNPSAVPNSASTSDPSWGLQATPQAISRTTKIDRRAPSHPPHLQRRAAIAGRATSCYPGGEQLRFASSDLQYFVHCLSLRVRGTRTLRRRPLLKITTTPPEPGAPPPGPCPCPSATLPQATGYGARAPSSRPPARCPWHRTRLPSRPSRYRCG
jgi:hypothetical protein